VKTGTLSSRDGSGLLNTWMVGFFPANRPEIAFAAHIATPGGGPVKAGLLTRFALETYLKLKKARMGQS
jgi:cell division protein FtsI/penicillin-binding protein 2